MDKKADKIKSKEDQERWGKSIIAKLMQWLYAPISNNQIQDIWHLGFLNTHFQITNHNIYLHAHTVTNCHQYIQRVDLKFTFLYAVSHATPSHPQTPINNPPPLKHTLCLPKSCLKQTIWPPVKTYNKGHSCSTHKYAWYMYLLHIINVNLDDTGHTWHCRHNFCIGLQDGRSWWRKQTREHLDPIIHALASRKLECWWLC